MKKSYSLEDFSAIKSAKQLVSAEIELDELPTIDEVKTLAKWTEDMLDLFEVDADIEKAKNPDGFDRSSALTRFAYSGAEQGWTDEQIMAALLDLDGRWKKYTGRSDRIRRFLIPIINRARQKIGYNPDIDIDVRGLLSRSDTSTEDRIRVYGAQEFVDAEFRTDWMVKDLLAQGGIGLIVGYAGTGKTQLSLQLGAVMALAEESFLSWENVSSTKRVLFMSMEMGAPSLHLFMSTIIGSYEDRNTLNRNLLLYPLGEPLPLDTEKGQAFFDSVMDEFKPDLVILDSLQKVVSKELTDEQAVKSLFHYLAFVRARHGCAMVVIHHNRKKPNDGQKHETSLSDVYGSTYITTDVDFVVSLKTVNKHVLSVEVLKNRLGPGKDSFEITRDESLRFHLDMEMLTNFDNREDGFDV